MKIVIQDIFLKQILIIRKDYLTFIKIYHFYLKEKKLKKSKNLFAAQKTKKKKVIYIGASKRALNRGLKLKNVHRIIQFKEKGQLKVYIDMNTELRKKAKNEFEKNFFKLMKNSVFGKTMENVRNHRGIKLITSDKRRKPPKTKSLKTKMVKMCLILKLLKWYQFIVIF